MYSNDVSSITTLTFSFSITLQRKTRHWESSCQLKASTAETEYWIKTYMSSFDSSWSTLKMYWNPEQPPPSTWTRRKSPSFIMSRSFFTHESDRTSAGPSTRAGSPLTGGLLAPLVGSTEPVSAVARLLLDSRTAAFSLKQLRHQKWFLVEYLYLNHMTEIQKPAWMWGYVEENWLLFCE